MLSAKDIHKRYGAVEVLKGVDITINPGEIVSIVGPSGSGKSTLLHILGTLDKPDRGQVSLNNENISRLQGDKLAAFRNRHIGFVFHHLLPEFSALENVCIPGWLTNRGKNEVKQRAEELLKILGLSQRLENKPNQLSGGEQQRIVIARALLNEPQILLADEPTGNLDPDVSNGIMRIFQLINKSGTAILMATHSYGLIKRFPTRILKCEEGKVFDSAVEKFELTNDY